VLVPPGPPPPAHHQQSFPALCPQEACEEGIQPRPLPRTALHTPPWHPNGACCRQQTGCRSPQHQRQQGPATQLHVWPNPHAPPQSRQDFLFAPHRTTCPRGPHGLRAPEGKGENPGDVGTSETSMHACTLGHTNDVLTILYPLVLVAVL